MGKTLKEEIAEARARAGLPPLEEAQRRKQKNPRGLKVVPPVADPVEPVTPVEKPSIAANAIAKAATAAPQRLAIAGDKWTGVPNDILDSVLRTLEPTDQVVLLRLYRLSWGFQKDWCEVSAGTLASACNISKRQAGVSTSRLEARGLIKRLKTARTETAKYKMLLPPAIAKNAIATNSIAANADTKDRALNKKDIKRPTPDDHMTPEEVKELIAKIERGEE